MATFEILDRSSDAFGRLCFAADTLNTIDESGIFYAVENCYWDFGAGLKWTTIVAYQYRNGEQRSWQVIYPPEHKILAEEPSIAEFTACIEEIHNRQERMFGRESQCAAASL